MFKKRYYMRHTLHFYIIMFIKTVTVVRADTVNK